MITDTLGEQVEAEALARSVVNEFESYVKLNKKVSPEVIGVVQQIEDYAKLADTVASHLAVKISDKQAMLETGTRHPAAGEGARLDGERNLGPAGREAHPHARQAPDGEDAARVLPQRADEGDPEGAGRRGRSSDELAELEDKIKKTKLSKEAREKATHELKKLRQMSPMSAEATVVRNYLDWLLSIPWGKKSKVKHDLNLAQEILDARPLRS